MMQRTPWSATALGTYAQVIAKVAAKHAKAKQILSVRAIAASPL